MREKMVSGDQGAPDPEIGTGEIILGLVLAGALVVSILSLL